MTAAEYMEKADSSAIRFLATKPTMIVTSLHENSKVNAGVFGAYTNLSSEHVGVAVSPRADTFKNILRSGEFVINIPPASLVKTIRILAHNYPPGISEVEEAGLTLRPAVTIKTPSIAECVAAVECVFDREMPTGSHHFVIGRVTGGWIRTSVATDEGRLDIFKAQVFKDFSYPKPLYVLPGEVVQG